MNRSETNLEATLRQAPRPAVPPGLRERLRRDARAALGSSTETGRETAQAASARESASPAANGAARPATTPRVEPAGGWRRWWPVLIPAGLTAALATVVSVQQTRIETLREEVRDLRDKAGLAAPPGVAAPAVSESPKPDGVPDERAALLRLRETAERLEGEVAELEQWESENEVMRRELAARQSAMSTDAAGLVEARERAESIQCVNHLKNLGLAVRVWATDNDDEFPPDSLSMSNELVTPKLLVCPSDTTRVAAVDWSSYSAATDCSYEFLSPGPGKFENTPNRVMWRCPIHGHITLCDGSVQHRVAKEHPDWLESRDGALYLKTVRPSTGVDPGDGTAGGFGESPGGGGVTYQFGMDFEWFFEGGETTKMSVPGPHDPPFLYQRYVGEPGAGGDAAAVGGAAEVQAGAQGAPMPWPPNGNVEWPTGTGGSDGGFRHLPLPMIRNGQVVGWVMGTPVVTPPTGVPEMIDAGAFVVEPPPNDGPSNPVPGP